MNSTWRNGTRHFMPNDWSQVMFTCTGIVVALENVLLIVVILSTPRLRTIANIIVSSLAATDAAVGSAISIFVVTISQVKLSAWVCQYVYTGLVKCCFGMILSSYLHVTAVALERYIYIARPFLYSQFVSERFIVKVVFGFWASLITFILVAVIFGNKSHDCRINVVFDENVAYVGCFIQLVLLFIISFAYFQIAKISLKQRRLVAAQTCGAASHHIGAAFTAGNWTQVVRSVRFYLVMAGTMTVFTIPTTVCVFVNGLYRSIDVHVFRYMLLLPIVQSGANLFINIFMNSDFRKSIQSLFTPKCLR